MRNTLWSACGILGSIAALVCVSGTTEAMPRAGTQESQCPAAASAGMNTFDWVVSGNREVFDTKLQVITSGPGGAPTSSLTIVGGRARVRSFTILAGASLRVVGPNPFRLTTTGDVAIRGRLILDGFDAWNVATLNTGSQPERGARGGPGGGKGGGASEVTNSSTPGGGDGFGPPRTTGGGQGGESAYAPGTGNTGGNNRKNNRRPGGGGGGRFARDQGSLFAQNGFRGANRGTGAISGIGRAVGGRANTGPFIDGNDENDFFGRKALLNPRGVPVGIIKGELSRLTAGYGGGGGGDAIPSSSFPHPNWSVSTDEKGGAGGGGGGAAEIRALGRIIFGAGGLISADGGQGALGENLIFLDHIGGSGGSGSGGHVLLESPNQIDFTDGDPQNAAVTRHLTAFGGPTVRGMPTDGVGNPIPQGISHGGAGGPGLLQLHVPPIGMTIGDSLNDTIVVPSAALASLDPFSILVQPTPEVLIPQRAGLPRVASRWMAPGLASLLIQRLMRVSTQRDAGGEWAAESTRIRFQVAADDGRGRPWEADLLLDWTANPQDLRVLQGAGPIWIRLELEFPKGAELANQE